MIWPGTYNTQRLRECDLTTWEKQLLLLHREMLMSRELVFRTPSLLLDLEMRRESRKMSLL